MSPCKIAVFRDGGEYLKLAIKVTKCAGAVLIGRKRVGLLNVSPAASTFWMPIQTSQQVQGALNA